MEGIPEGTTAEQLQALIDGARMELLRLTQEEDARRIQEVAEEEERRRVVEEEAEKRRVEEEEERKRVEEEERRKAADEEEARRVAQEQQERETDEETRTQKTRRKQKGKAKTRVAKRKRDSLPGPSKRARGVARDSGDEGEVKTRRCRQVGARTGTRTRSRVVTTVGIILRRRARRTSWRRTCSCGVRADP